MRERWQRLRLRLRKQGTKAASPTVERTITLADYNSEHTGPLESLMGIDALSPPDPHLPTTIPSEIDMQLWIKAYLDGCRDMFDEGTLNYLDVYLTEQEGLWRQASHLQEHTALTTAHRLRGANAGHLREAQERQAVITARRAHLEQEITTLRDRLRGKGHPPHDH